MVSYPRSLFITAKWLRLDPTSEVAGGRDRYLSPLTCLTLGHLKDMMEREFEHPEIESMEPENEKWEFGKFISNSFISCLNVYTVYMIYPV